MHIIRNTFDIDGQKPKNCVTKEENGFHAKVIIVYVDQTAINPAYSIDRLRGLFWWFGGKSSSLVFVACPPGLTAPKASTGLGGPASVLPLFRRRRHGSVSNSSTSPATYCQCTVQHCRLTSRSRLRLPTLMCFALCWDDTPPDSPHTLRLYTTPWSISSLL